MKPTSCKKMQTNNYNQRQRFVLDVHLISFDHIWHKLMNKKSATFSNFGLLEPLIASRYYCVAVLLMPRNLKWNDVKGMSGRS